MLASLFAEETVIDAILSAAIMPHIILFLNKAELVNGEKGLVNQLSTIFGDIPLKKTYALFDSFSTELDRRRKVEEELEKTEQDETISETQESLEAPVIETKPTVETQPNSEKEIMKETPTEKEFIAEETSEKVVGESKEDETDAEVESKVEENKEAKNNE